MPKVSKRLMRKLLKKSKSSSEAYPWIRVPRPEGVPIPEKVHEANRILKDIVWTDPRFGPNAID